MSEIKNVRENVRIGIEELEQELIDKDKSLNTDEWKWMGTTPNAKDERFWVLLTLSQKNDISPLQIDPDELADFLGESSQNKNDLVDKVLSEIQLKLNGNINNP